jgi:transposase
MRKELTDNQWNRIKHLIPSIPNGKGRPSICSRIMLNAILWILRTGAPWRDMPDAYGNWKSVYTRFSRWSKQGIWQNILEALS